MWNFKDLSTLVTKDHDHYILEFSLVEKWADFVLHKVTKNKSDHVR